MDPLQQLLTDYIAEHSTGGVADPQVLLSRAEPTQRERLAELIDGYLARAPRQAFDPVRFAQSPAARIVANLETALDAEIAAWPVLLPRLRVRAALKRSELVARLADGLGVSAKRDKVAVYYHQMEQGQIPGAAVTDRVLDVLGDLLGETRQSLRSAGERSGPPTGVAGLAAFARTAVSAASAGAPGDEGPPQAEDSDWDEVDELFLGG
jgi:hypothetical protein